MKWWGVEGDGGGGVGGGGGGGNILGTLPIEIDSPLEASSISDGAESRGRQQGSRDCWSHTHTHNVKYSLLLLLCSPSLRHMIGQNCGW